MTNITTATDRLLGLAEQAFWAMARRHTNQFTLAVEVEGEISATQCTVALSALVVRHPLLSVRIEPGEGGKPKFASPARLGPSVAVEHSDWRGVMGAELSRPFDIESGPLIRLTLVPSADGTTLVLSAFHAAADAWSAVYLLRDLLQSVAGKPIAAWRENIALEDHFAETLAQAEPPSLPDGPLPSARFRTPDLAAPVVVTASLPAAELAQLRALARAHRTTVHSILAVVLTNSLRELAPHRSDETLRMCSMVDLRRMSPSIDDDVGLYTAPALTAEDPTSADFWDQVAAFGSRLGPLASPAGVAASHAALAAVMSQMPDADTTAHVLSTVVAHDVLLSNLGVIDLPEQYGPFTLRHVWGPVVLAGYEEEQMIGAATFGGVLRLSHASHQPIEGLLDVALVQLRALLDQEHVSPVAVIGGGVER